MRLRRLQIKDDGNKWYDDAYAYEDNDRQVIFRYSVLTWNRIGKRYSDQLKEAGTSLEEIETIIFSGDNLRWLPIEVIKSDQAEAYLETLDEACAIPKPGKVSIAKTVAA